MEKGKKWQNKKDLKEHNKTFKGQTYRVISCEKIATNITLVGGPIIVMSDGPKKEDVIQ